jgi:hypothetical protein
MLAAMRRASSLVNSFAADSTAGLVLVIDAPGRSCPSR